MSNFYVGLTEQSMKKAMIMWNGYTETMRPDEAVHVRIDGTLDLTKGKLGQEFTGLIEITTNTDPEYADYSYLASLCAAPFFFLKDLNNVVHKVLWSDTLTVNWIAKNASLGYVAFRFVEVKE